MFVPDCNVDTAEMVEAIQEARRTIEQSTHPTFTGLERELFGPGGRLSDARFDNVRSGCDLFRMRLTKHQQLLDGEQSMAEVRRVLADRCRYYLAVCEAGPTRIVNDLLPFVRPSSRILVHGCGSCLATAVKCCVNVAPGVQFYVTEGRPSRTGFALLNKVKDVVSTDGDRSVPHTGPRFSVPTTTASTGGTVAAFSRPSSASDDQQDRLLAASFHLVPDAAVGGLMSNVDFVLCGAHCVTEHGGLVHSTGTLQIALVAQAMSVPVYVLCETFKFSRIFPMGSADLAVRPAKRQPTAVAASTGNEADAAVPSTGPSGAASSVPPSSPPIGAANIFGAGGAPQAPLPHASGGSASGGDVRCLVKPVEFVPPELVTLLFTEQGIMPPTAVAHEMFRIHTAREVVDV